jgi:hypothetical protein
MRTMVQEGHVVGLRNITRLCLTKQAFPTKEAAEAERAKLQALRTSRYRGLHVYRCDACAQFHLGNGGRKRRVG